MLNPIPYPRSSRRNRGSWQLLKSNQGNKGASFTCPDCGKTHYIDHEIWNDGLVTPGVVCPTKGCSFHEHIKLEGWEMAA